MVLKTPPDAVAILVAAAQQHPEGATLDALVAAFPEPPPRPTVHCWVAELVLAGYLRLDTSRWPQRYLPGERFPAIPAVPSCPAAGRAPAHAEAVRDAAAGAAEDAGQPAAEGAITTAGKPTTAGAGIALPTARATAADAAAAVAASGARRDSGKGAATDGTDVGGAARPADRTAIPRPDSAAGNAATPTLSYAAYTPTATVLPTVRAAVDAAVGVAAGAAARLAAAELTRLERTMTSTRERGQNDPHFVPSGSGSAHSDSGLTAVVHELARAVGAAAEPAVRTAASAEVRAALGTVVSAAVHEVESVILPNQKFGPSATTPAAAPAVETASGNGSGNAGRDVSGSPRERPAVAVPTAAAATAASSEIGSTGSPQTADPAVGWPAVGMPRSEAVAARESAVATAYGRTNRKSVWAPLAVAGVVLTAGGFWVWTAFPTVGERPRPATSAASAAAAQAAGVPAIRSPGAAGATVEASAGSTPAPAMSSVDRTAVPAAGQPAISVQPEAGAAATPTAGGAAPRTAGQGAAAAVDLGVVAAGPAAGATARPTAELTLPASGSTATSAAGPASGGAVKPATGTASPAVDYPARPGAYVQVAGRWQRLPRNHDHLSQTTEQAVAMTSAWSAEPGGGNPAGRADALAVVGAIVLDGYEDVPVVPAGQLTFVYIGERVTADAAQVAKYPALRALAPVEIVPLKTRKDGGRSCAVRSPAPGFMTAGPDRLPATIETPADNVTVMKCTLATSGPNRAPARYALLVGIVAYEVAAR